MNRRKFVKNCAASLPTVFFSKSLLANAHLFNSNSIRVRREITDPLAITDLRTYAKAVRILRSLPRSDGRNWTNQAEIHLNGCLHGSWLFFPWHREYILRFESIIRKVTDSPEFALPYWDWTKNPEMPKVFEKIDDLLFSDLAVSNYPGVADPSRGEDIASKLVNATKPEVMKPIMETSEFKTFMGSSNASGIVEVGPHNGPHIYVGLYGGPLGNFTSPLDPLFWVHHCNADRVWAAWQSRFPEWSDEAEISELYGEDGNGVDFLNSPTGNFYDDDGNEIENPSIVKEILKTSNIQNNAYTYDNLQVTKETIKKKKLHFVTLLHEPSVANGPVITKGSNHFVEFKFTELSEIGPPISEFIEEFFNGNSYRYSFRMKLQNLPNIHVPNSGPMIRVSAFTPTYQGEIEHHFGNFCVFSHHGGHSMHADQGMMSSLQNVNFSFSSFLEKLKFKESFSSVPKETVLRISYLNPENNEPFELNKDHFKDVKVSLEVVE